MALTLDSLTFDCGAPVVVATFWSRALGFELDPEADDEGAWISDPSGKTQGMYFQRVPEGKVAKNRVHPDVRPSGSMAEEVERLTELGATQLEFIDVGTSFWTQMRDPEGNEFCVLRGPVDGWTPDEL
ncbi:MAG: hypothetical protein QOE25_257 [Actinomycetota bacterium]|nr:hypothetical protein [Actinomycetota bacterium]